MWFNGIIFFNPKNHYFLILACKIVVVADVVADVTVVVITVTSRGSFCLFYNTIHTLNG